MRETTPAEVDQIREIVTRFVRRKVPIDNDTALVSAGLIESMSLISLILQLENAFKVSLPVTEIAPEDLDSVRKIADTMARFR